MKTIVVLALLAAAGCGGKKDDKAAPADKGSPCGDAINKGMDGMEAALKERAGSGGAPPALLSVVGKLRTTLIERCTQDSWPPEALTCYSAATTQPQIRACQDKLNEDQRTKLSNQIRQVMLGGMQMPPGAAGHPPTLQGSAAPAAPPAPADGAPPAAPPAAPATPPAAPAAPATPPAAAPAAAGSAAAPAGSGW